MREKQREETRRRLYLAALEVFRRDGVAGCKIEDIARLAEVSRAAFYFHFPTKDAVLLQLMQEAEEPFLTAINALPKDHTPLQLLETINLAMATFWKDRRELLPDAYGAALRAMGNISDLEYFGARARVAELFKSLQDRGLMNRDFPAQAFSESFLHASMIVLLTWLRTPEVPLEPLMKKGAGLFHRCIKVD